MSRLWIYRNNKIWNSVSSHVTRCGCKKSVNFYSKFNETNNFVPHNFDFFFQNVKHRFIKKPIFIPYSMEFNNIKFLIDYKLKNEYEY